MQNDEGTVVEKYVPRKCSWTHKLLPATDRGSVQINIADLDSHGVYKKVTKNKNNYFLILFIFFLFFFLFVFNILCLCVLHLFLLFVGFFFL